MQWPCRCEQPCRHTVVCLSSDIKFNCCCFLQSKHYKPFAFQLVEPELDENHVEIGRKDIQLACENQVEFNAWFEALEVQYRHARMKQTHC